MPLPENIKQVHFIGIGGYGMSALAAILLQNGYRVSGSDIKESPLLTGLTAKGAAVSIGHHAENLGTAELVVYSTAIKQDNPELAETSRRGLPLWHRSELLAALLNDAYGIAIAGAHGKTTTTAMVALLLEAGGLDPTAIIGGVLPAYNSNARLGKSDYLVAEADESDRSFTRYYPRLALVTGMEADHLEHYENDYERLLQAYRTFLSNLEPQGAAVLCFDDPALRRLATALNHKIISYGLEESAEEPPLYTARRLRFIGSGSIFDLYREGTLLDADLQLGVPGRHNILNAVGALALVHHLGLDPAACAHVLASFYGVGRRFELIGTAGGIKVIDDYAHHPTEIKATLEAARPSAERLICLFQPHRYSRTAYFFDEFARAFEEADQLLLHSVYSAGEEPLPGVSSTALAERIRAVSQVPVYQSDDLSALEEKAAAIARPGDLIMTMGAGDVTAAAPRIVKLLKERS